MSTMPVTPRPASAPGTPATDLLAAAGGAVALGNVPASETGAGFLALVQQALHLVDGEAAPGQAGTGDVAQDDTAGDEQDPAATENGDLAALMNVVPLIPGLPVTPAATGTGGDAPATAAVGAAAAAPTAPATSALPATAAREAKAEPAATDAPATDSDGTTPVPDAPATAPNATESAAPATTSPAPTATSAAPATSAATTAPGSAPAATPATPALDPVTTQVVDRITSMVDRGTGTHRVTMKLNPEQLGEVRIVMTVRDGAVHVRLAASEHQAHQSLVEGSAELNRLLEAAGATDARITVRETGRSFAGDLGQSSSHGWGAGSGTTDPGAGEGRASGRSPNEHAGTRAEQVATDGTHDPRRFAAGQTGNRSNESVTSSRVSGLDVTM